METTDIKVRFNTIDQVKEFVGTMRKFPVDADVFSTNQNFMVDAKSILGVFSLGLERDLTVRLYEDNTDAVVSSLEPFMCIA